MNTWFIFNNKIFLIDHLYNKQYIEYLTNYINND